MKRRSANVRNHREHSAAANADLVARVCWYHFHENQTQQEIADRIGLSRVTINKIISDAFSKGFVRISIDTPLAPCFELEAKLREKFNLQEAIVVPSPRDEDEVRTPVGIAAGDYISKTLREGQILGLSWGGTIYAAARALQPRSKSRNIVVSLSGGLHRSTIINPYDNAAMFARVLDAQCYYITAPMFADSSRTRNALLMSEPVRAVLEIAKKIDIALLTATDLTPHTWIIKHGALSPETLKSLVAAGSVGCVCDRYLDSRGRAVNHWVNERTVSVPLEVIQGAPHIVLAAGGAFKVPIIRAALNANLAHVLITDERAAKALLDAPSGDRPVKKRSSSEDS